MKRTNINLQSYNCKNAILLHGGGWKKLEKFKIKAATLRILYVPTKLSKKLNNQEIITLKNKFKTNKFGTFDKIFNKINKLHNLKKISKNNLFCDDLRKT